MFKKISIFTFIIAVVAVGIYLSINLYNNSEVETAQAQISGTLHDCGEPCFAQDIANPYSGACFNTPVQLLCYNVALNEGYPSPYGPYQNGYIGECRRASNPTDATCGQTTTGVCGTAARTFTQTETFPGSYTYCTSGALVPATPSAPAIGSFSTWNCGTTSCSAFRQYIGTCGTANGHFFPYNATSYGSYTQCTEGFSYLATNTNFPPAGGSVDWVCPGLFGGRSSNWLGSVCRAYRDEAPPTPPIQGDPPQCLTSETWTYSPTANTWTMKTPTTSPSIRGRMSMVWDNQNNQIILYGGSTEDRYHSSQISTFYNDTWVYDPDNGAQGVWTKKNPLHNPGPRAEFDLAWINHTKEALFFGGRQLTNQIFQDTWFYDPNYPADITNGEWIQQTTQTLPGGDGQDTGINLIGVDCYEAQIDFSAPTTDPATTTFSIKVENIDTATISYVQSDYTLGTNAYYQTYANWNPPVTITGLNRNQDYNISYNYSSGAEGAASSAGNFTSGEITNRSGEVQSLKQAKVGEIIYYIWSEKDINNIWQIWTGSATIGSPETFTATQRTNYTGISGTNPDIEYHNGKLFYSWNHNEMVTAVHTISGDVFTATSRGSMPSDSQPEVQLSITENKVYYFWQGNDRYIFWGTTNLDGANWSQNSYQLPVSSSFTNTIKETSFYLTGSTIFLIYQNRSTADISGELSNSYLTIAKIQTNGTGFASANVNEYQDSGNRTKYGNSSNYKIFAFGNDVFFLGVLNPRLDISASPVPTIPPAKQIWMAKTDSTLVGFSGSNFVTIDSAAGHSEISLDISRDLTFYITTYLFKLIYATGPSVIANTASGFQYDSNYQLNTATIDYNLTGLSVAERISDSIKHNNVSTASGNSYCDNYYSYVNYGTTFQIAKSDNCNDPSANASDYSDPILATPQCTIGISGDPGCDINVVGGTISGTWPNTGYGEVTVVCVDGNPVVPGGSTLTIQPGVVVKHIETTNTNEYIINRGTLNIGDPTGADTRPVYFTHIYDDTTPDGDTGRDGHATTPTAGKWGGTNGISMESANASYQGTGVWYNVIIRYTRDQAITVDQHAAYNHTSPTFNNLTIENGSGKGIYAERAYPVLENSTIRYLGGTALDMYGPYQTNFILSGTHDIHHCGTNGITITPNFYNRTMWHDTTFYNDIPYVIASASYIFLGDGANLTLEAGTIIKFMLNTDMDVAGTLIAQGTESNPIYFTSIKDDTVGIETHSNWFDADGNCLTNYPCDTNNDGSATMPAPADWYNLFFDARYGEATGTVQHTVIRYGGGTNSEGMLKLYDHNTYGETEPTFNNVLVEYSALQGVYIVNANPTFANSTFNNNTLAAVYLFRPKGLTNIEFLGNNTVDNNGINAVHADYNSFYGAGIGSITFYNDIPYYMAASGPYVANGSTVTIEKGAVLKFPVSTASTFTVYGTLNVVGTSEEPVYFTSILDDTVGGDTNNDGTATSPAPGNWAYVFFDSNNGPATGQIDYAEFRYAGNNTGNYGAVRVWQHNDLGQPEPTFNNCTFRNNSKSGLHIYHANVPINNFSAYNNTGPAIYMSSVSSGTGIISTGNNVAVNNSTNGIAVELLYSENNIDRDTAWASELPYYVYGSHLKVDNGDTWTIEPGTIIKHGIAQENFEINGTLIAEGTATDPIIFTSIRDDSIGGDTNNDGAATSPAPNNWGSLWFRSNGGVSTGNLDNVTIKYAGRGSTGGNYGETYAAIAIEDHNTNNRSEPTMSNIIIENSGNYGIYHTQSNIHVTNLTVRNTSLAAVYTNGPCNNSIATFAGDITLENNGFNANQVHSHVGYGGCTVFNTNLTYSPTIPYYFEGTSTTVNDNINLTFEPGAIVKFASAYAITNYGHINAIGTADQPIYFTSIKDDTVGGDTNNDGSISTPAKGNWEGIHNWSYSGATPIGNFKYVTFRYGGGGSAPYYNHELSYRDITADTSEVSYCNFNFTNKGIRSENSKVNIHHNTFSSASDYGMHYYNPPAGTVFEYNTIDTFDTGIFLEYVNNKIIIRDNYIDTAINGILSQTANAGGGGIEMRSNFVDAGSYYIRNTSTPFQTPAGGTTVDAYQNTWGAYPVSDYSPGKMYKNPGNILYDNHGVNITSPAGGETWAPGSTHNITWDTYNDGGNSATADIYYSVDGGENWILIIDNIPHTGGALINGSYTWVLPKTASLQALIKVNILDNAENVITSDISKFFFISESQAALEVILSDPRPGASSGASNILYTNVIASTTTNGSVKITFAPDFDFTGLTAADVVATGGNITWSASEIIDTVNNTVVFPFTGQLDSSDGTLRFEFGGTNQITNPPLVGIYNVDIAIYPTADGTGAYNEIRDAKISINLGFVINANIPSFIVFDMSRAAVPSGENVNGAATNFATTSPDVLNFGGISGGDNFIAAHDITIDTNLDNGYLLEVRYTGKLSGPTDINDFTGTNETPATWLVPSSNGYFGYTTTHSAIPTGGDPDRFTSGGGNKWAAFETTYRAIAGSTGPATETTRIGYRLNLAPTFGTTGVYATEIIYIATSFY